MGRHYRRYCFHLAERLKMSVKELTLKLDSHEISEWMAFDLTREENWIKSYKKQLELEQSKEMTNEEKLKAFKRLFKGRE